MVTIHGEIIIRIFKEASNRYYLDTFDDALVFCQTCRHGGHAVHIMEWFFGSEESETSGHKECAVADCNCNCALEAGYEDETDV